MKTVALKVAEFADVYSGGTPSTRNPNYWNGEVVWITPKDMSSHTGIYIEDGERYITEQGLNESSACLLPSDTVILSSRAPIGYVAVARGQLSTNQGCKNLRCKEGIAHPVFVYYLLKSNTATLEAHATGSTYKELSASRLKNITFCLPEVDVQARIAAILSTYDDLIENNRRRIQLLEQAARLLYREWFVHLRFSGHEHVTITDSVPEGWEKMKISDVCETVGGGTPRTQDH
jgi:type I restriction enzyme S subunit